MYRPVGLNLLTVSFWFSAVSVSTGETDALDIAEQHEKNLERIQIHFRSRIKNARAAPIRLRR